MQFQLYKKLRAIQPEVSYGYYAIDYQSITKDLQIYPLNELVQPYTKSKCDDSGMISRFDDTLYFSAQYGRHGKLTYDKDGRSQNHYSFDVGIFRLNLMTMKCEQVFDFQELFAVGTYGYQMPKIVYDANREQMLLCYNGYIGILDLHEKKMTDQVLLYDKDKYRNRDYMNAGYDAENRAFHLIDEDRLPL